VRDKQENNSPAFPDAPRELFQLHPPRSNVGAVDADCRLSISGSKRAAFDEANAIAFQPSEKHLKRIAPVGAMKNDKERYSYRLANHGYRYSRFSHDEPLLDDSYFWTREKHGKL